MPGVIFFIYIPTTNQEYILLKNSLLDSFAHLSNDEEKKITINFKSKKCFNDSNFVAQAPTVKSPIYWGKNGYKNQLDNGDYIQKKSKSFISMEAVSF